MNSALQSTLIDLGCGLALLITWPWMRRGKKRLALRAKLRAQAVRERTVHAAAGIKGDGFSALFHLHRALHYRIKAVSAEVCAAALYLAGVVTGRDAWWMALPFQIAAILLFLKGAKDAGLADAMAEIAMEAVSKGDQKADCAMLPEPGEEI